MTDETARRGEADRKGVPESEGYDVAPFARKHGITLEEARAIVQRFGPSRSRCDAEAEKLKARGR